MSDEYYQSLLDFDWSGHEGPKNPKPYIKQFPLSVISVPGETPYERKMRMLLPMSQTCLACSMCELGLKIPTKGRFGRDPHVFSNMNPTRFMVVGQNPGWNELEQNEPFVGAAGQNFTTEVEKHGLNKSDFYITNAVKCFTDNNARPTTTNIERCSTFLRMELNLIKPLLVITLGGIAFSEFCSCSVYSECLNKLTKSEKYNVNVFAIYHPSPLNIKNDNIKAGFETQVSVMCALVKALKVKHNIN